MHGPRQRVGAKLSSPTEKFPPELDVDVETDAGMVELNLRKTSMTDDGVPVLLWRDGRVKKYPVPISQVYMYIVAKWFIQCFVMFLSRNKILLHSPCGVSNGFAMFQNNAHRCTT